MQTEEPSDRIERLAAELQGASALELIAWGADVYGEGLTFACSFGAEDVVLLDMLCKSVVSPNVFVLDTGRLHQETYEAMERCRSRYNVEFDVYTPDTEALQTLLRTKGALSFYESVENRKECCHIRKVEPLNRALEGKSAWITGLRRSQAVTRADMKLIETDRDHGGIVKLNPLADWTEEDVWSYIRSNGVPYNSLHDRGFPSIGCVPCTRAVLPGEDVRAGRWWWESADLKECGLHARRERMVPL